MLHKKELIHNKTAACAVRAPAMSCVSSGSYENSDKNREPVFPVPAYPLPVSCSDLVQEQKEDPTLQALYCQVLPDHEVESATCCYFLQKWAFVLPAKLRPLVLQIAHDGVSGVLPRGKENL